MHHYSDIQHSSRFTEHPKGYPKTSQWILRIIISLGSPHQATPINRFPSPNAIFVCKAQQHLPLAQYLGSNEIFELLYGLIEEPVERWQFHLGQVEGRSKWRNLVLHRRVTPNILFLRLQTGLHQEVVPYPVSQLSCFDLLLSSGQWLLQIRNPTLINPYILSVGVTKTSSHWKDWDI